MAGEMNDEIGHLGPKDWQGVDKKFLSRSKVVNAPARPLKGAPLKSKPDLPAISDAALKEDKLFPVKILKNYRPMSLRYQYADVPRDEDGNQVGDLVYKDPMSLEECHAQNMDEGMVYQIPEETYAMLPISEAREVIKRGIAERNDEMQA